MAAQAANAGAKKASPEEREAEVGMVRGPKGRRREREHEEGDRNGGIGKWQKTADGRVEEE